MFHLELGKMFTRTRAVMLENNRDNFSFRKVDKDLKALNENSQYDYLLTFRQEITQASME